MVGADLVVEALVVENPEVVEEVQVHHHLEEAGAEGVLLPRWQVVLIWLWHPDIQGMWASTADLTHKDQHCISN